MQTSMSRFAARPTGALTVPTDMMEKFDDMVYKGTIGTTLDAAIHDVIRGCAGDETFNHWASHAQEQSPWTS